MTPGWCSFTVSPLRLASSKAGSVSAGSEPSSFTGVGSDSVPASPAGVSPVFPSARALLVRGLAVAGATVAGAL